MEQTIRRPKVARLPTALSILWFTAYAGGGAYRIACYAFAHQDDVPPFIPLLIFAWVVGFFVGHALLEKFRTDFLACLRVERPGAEGPALRVKEIPSVQQSRRLWTHPVFSSSTRRAIPLLAIVLATPF